MKHVIDIGYLYLFSAYILFIIPLYILWHYKTGLLKDAFIAIVRMTIQLLLVGFYLEFIFKLNSQLLNITWVFLMTLIAAYTIVKRSELSYKLFIFPVSISIIISILISDSYFLGIVIRLDNLLDARYFIPITGMLLGNSLKSIIIALNSYYGQLQSEQNFFKWHLANGATLEEALLPFMREALKKAFNPIIAGTAIVGLISLPGMMTGQILGGSSPQVAIKYQIMLMITIFSASVISVVLTILISNRFVFDDFDNMGEVMRLKKRKPVNK